MFNALESHEIVLAVGKLLRAAADEDGSTDDYKRSQLLSGYSVARHLAAEQAGASELLEQTRAELVDALTASSHPAATRVAEARSAAVLGELLAELLLELRDDDLRVRLHRALRAMADREVAALARASG